MPLKPGQRLQDRYQIDRVIGIGGMGQVYRAYDIRLDVYVAIKEMFPPSDKQDLQQFHEQFENEARILARLNHPNLARVTDSFRETLTDAHYLVMDFVEGKNLAEHIQRIGTIPESLILNWAGQILDALSYCHGQQIIHRDVKPQNVIIRPNGQVVLVDFGLAKQWRPDASTTIEALKNMGTPAYAPPEQFNYTHTDPRSDIYSLGATLYHALTKSPPPDTAERVNRSGILKPIEDLNPDVSQDTAQVIYKAMELDPSKRFQTAKDMKFALLGQATTSVLYIPNSHTLLRSRLLKKPFAIVILVVLVFILFLSSLWLIFDKLGIVHNATVTLSPTSSISMTGGGTSTLTPTILPPSSPTHTSSPTPTPDPTLTPSPTLHPTSTPIPGPITLMNVSRIARLESWTENKVSALAVQQFGQKLAVGVLTRVHILDASNLAPLAYISQDDFISALSFNTKGDVLATGLSNGSIYLYTVDDLEKVVSFTEYTSAVHSLVFSRDDTHLISLNIDGVLSLWDIENRQEVNTIQLSDDRVVCADLNPCKNELILGTEKGVIEIWNLDNHRRRFSLNADSSPVQDISFSHDCVLFAVALTNGDIHLHDSLTGEVVTMLVGHKETAHTLVFNEQGDVLVTGVADNTVRLWDIAERATTRILTGHEAPVQSVMFGFKSRKLLSLDTDGTFIIWGEP